MYFLHLSIWEQEKFSFWDIELVGQEGERGVRIKDSEIARKNKKRER